MINKQGNVSLPQEVKHSFEAQNVFAVRNFQLFITLHFCIMLNHCINQSMKLFCMYVNISWLVDCVLIIALIQLYLAFLMAYYNLGKKIEKVSVTFQCGINTESIFTKKKNSVRKQSDSDLNSIAKVIMKFINYPISLIKL